jgi:hypothetical protein
MAAVIRAWRHARPHPPASAAPVRPPLRPRIPAMPLVKLSSPTRDASFVSRKKPPGSKAGPRSDRNVAVPEFGLRGRNILEAILSGPKLERVSLHLSGTSPASRVSPGNGRIASRHERPAGCGGRGRRARQAWLLADGEVVWSWRLDAVAKFCGKASAKRRWQEGRPLGSTKQTVGGRLGLA